MAERQVTARVDEGLHARCVTEAKARGMSLDAFAGKLVAEGIEQLIPAADFRLTRRTPPAAPVVRLPDADEWLKLCGLVADTAPEDVLPVCQGSGALALSAVVPGGILPVWRCALCGAPVGTDVDDDGNVTAQEHARSQIRPDPLAGG